MRAALLALLLPVAAAAEFVRIPLHSLNGTLAVHVSLGDRGPLFLRVDTTTSLVTVPARGCESCRPAGPCYELYESSHTRTIAPCDRGCAACSTSGACLFTDELHGATRTGVFAFERLELLGTRTMAVIVRLGAVLNVSRPRSLAPEHAELGVLGLGLPLKVRHRTSSTFVEALMRWSLASQPVFCMCMGGGGSGTLAIGGVDASLFTSALQWAPLYPSSTLYAVGVHDLAVSVGARGGAAQRVTLSAGLPLEAFPAAVIDPSSGPMQLPAPVYDALAALLSAGCELAHSNADPRVCARQRRVLERPHACIDAPPAELGRWPELELVLDGGARVRVPPAAYLYEEERGSANRSDGAAAAAARQCVRLAVRRRSVSRGQIVLGSRLLAQVLLVVDRAAGRAGFAQPNRAQCGARGPSPPPENETAPASSCPAPPRGADDFLSGAHALGWFSGWVRAVLLSLAFTSGVAGVFLAGPLLLQRALGLVTRVFSRRRRLGAEQLLRAPGSEAAPADEDGAGGEDASWYETDDDAEGEEGETEGDDDGSWADEADEDAREPDVEASAEAVDVDPRSGDPEALHPGLDADAATPPLPSGGSLELQPAGSAQESDAAEVREGVDAGAEERAAGAGMRRPARPPVVPSSATA